MSSIETRFAEVVPPTDWSTVRHVRERSELLRVRQDIVQPVAWSENEGAMVTVCDGSGLGYAATPDTTRSGLARAVERARSWARATAGRGLFDARALRPPGFRGEYELRAEKPWASLGLGDKLALLVRESQRLKVGSAIADWEVALWYSEVETLLIASDGSRAWQRYSWLLPSMSASANAGSETQTRSLGGQAYARQGGLEILDQIGFFNAAPRLGAEALELLAAEDCPSGTMPVLLMPDQMILQIHESIGHPLELDRILGDERNYAGTSFVTLDMFGSYRYGSELLNVTYDPARPGELASFAFDDEGTAARREHLIRDGVLLRPLGGATSQARAGVPGVANARASTWNRAPIDRMANLNLEPGTSSLEALLASIDHGVCLATNRSWSIDDSRNKFQFGCEWGRRIERGRLGPVVRNGNYRGISATFWRNLRGVGDASTVEVLGTPYCGKGEPNQLIRVGHSSPACVFGEVEVFGGATR